MRIIVYIVNLLRAQLSIPCYKKMIYLKICYFNFYYLLFISTMLIVTYCAPLAKDSDATILAYNNTNDGKGNYYFSFETSNGIIREETGTLVDVGLPNEHISVKGVYSYLDPEGVPVTLEYTADENGYIILTPPPPQYISADITPEVLASLLGK